MTQKNYTDNGANIYVNNIKTQRVSISVDLHISSNDENNYYTTVFLNRITLLKVFVNKTIRHDMAVKKWCVWSVGLEGCMARKKKWKKYDGDFITKNIEIIHIIRVLI